MAEDNTKNNIEKALAAIDTALEVEPVGEEIQLDSTVQFDGFEMMEDGSAEQITDETQVDLSNVPFNANLAEYISDNICFLFPVANIYNTKLFFILNICSMLSFF